MGFDIYGKADKSYFRANCWSWRPILSLIYKVNQKDQLGLDLTNWGYNDGAGLKTQFDCNKLAFSVEREVVLNKTYRLESKLRVDSTGRFLKDDESGGVSVYSATGAKIMEFAVFLRNCGGSFEIW